MLVVTYYNQPVQSGASFAVALFVLCLSNSVLYVGGDTGSRVSDVGEHNKARYAPLLSHAKFNVLSKKNYHNDFRSFPPCKY